jgi:C4-dicarboxylate transporter, DctM subunit
MAQIMEPAFDAGGLRFIPRLLWMDIYSAIVVIVPLITPIARAYGVDPVHLGIMFLANMELGYLMPPMGENLFLSSYRFGKSLPEVYRSTLPYAVILLIAVLVITYVPSLTLWLVRIYDARAVLQGAG